MRNRHQLDSDDAKEAMTARAIVASLCVLGLASLMWIHSGSVVVPNDGNAATMAATPAGESGSLLAPTTDPSLPSLEATFSRKEQAPADSAIPTF